jgi:outer membrane immunogenic protein
MGRKFWGSFGLLASVLAGAGAAGAADLAVQAPVYKAAPPVYSDWSGFYIGVHGGYGWGDMSFDSPFGYTNGKPKGGVFGGQAGYNWQFGSFVTGLEVDYSGADLTDSSGTIFSPFFNRETKVDQLGSARARVGYTVLPDLLVYGTGGLGWGHTEVNESLNFGRFGIAGSSDVSSVGWTAGAGLEYKLYGHWLVRGEYLHYDLGKSTYSFPFPFFTKDASTTVDVARAGLSYKF